MIYAHDIVNPTEMSFNSRLVTQEWARVRQENDISSQRLLCSI